MAPPDWRSPWRPPLALLLLMLASCLLLSVSAFSSLATPFPKDLQPISVVGREQSGHYPGFHGLVQDNDTVRLGLDFQRMLRINHVLYIAARDHVFAVNLTTASEHFVPHLKLTWKSTDVSKCRVRGKNSDECYNYVKVLVPRNDETLFACGTNAFNPTCRNYKMNTLEQVGEDVLGQARCPFESGQSNVGLFAGGDFYSATMTDFLASDAVIYRSLGDDRPVLRTVKYDSKWLREPHFLHAIDYGNYVYFFLREIAVEYTALGKVVFSRVARVCKNDNGGSPRVLEKYWTSFLKARLNCSIPGDSFFYFDVLQSLTNVLQINQRPTVVGLFTTQSNSIPGSAVCLYYMDDIEKVFNGRFKEQRTSDSSWTPVPEDQVPKPRPGCCAGDGAAAEYKSSVQFPDESLSFIKSFPLMDESVPSVNHTPCYTHTAHRVRLTQVAVDTIAGPFKDRTVLFLGSEDGRVQKVLINSHPNDTTGPVLLEDITVYNPTLCNVAGQEDRSIMGLELDKEHHALFVAFSGCVIRVPLSRCTQHGTCRTACLSSRDPYCVWLRSGGCANMVSGLRTGFEQDIDGDQPLYSETCHDVMTTTHNHDNADSAYGVRGLADMELRWGSSVHYTLLVACVLVAFLLGAILSGLLVSCYCGRGGSSHRRRGGGVGGRLGKDDPEAALPHALSLRSLAKLNGLAKEEKLDGSSSQMYSSFIPNLHNPTPSTPTPHHSLPLGDPDLSQGEGDVSGLPTPDSTPELPIKNMRPFCSQQWERNRNGNNAATETNPAGFVGPASGSGLGSSPGFMAIVGSSMAQQNVFPFSSSSSSSQHHHHHRLHGNLSGGASSSSLHLPEERKASHEEHRGTGPAHHHLSQQSLPQAVVDVSALDELLQHIQEVSAAGNGGIRVLTSTSSVFPANPSSSSSGGGGAYHHATPPHRAHHYNPSGHHHHPLGHGSQPRLLQKPHPLPQAESAPYFTSSTLPMDAAGTSSFSSTSSSSSSNPASSSSNPTSSTSVPASSPCSSTPLQRQVIPEFPGDDASAVAGAGVGVASRGLAVARHHSQRHSLIKMGSGGGGGVAVAVSRHHSFNQHPRGAPPTSASSSYFLARMNTNNSSSNAMAACTAASVTANTTASMTARTTASMTANTTSSMTANTTASTTANMTANTTANTTATGLTAGGVLPPHFLARMNTNSSSNGPKTSPASTAASAPGVTAGAASSAASRLTASANGGSCQRPVVAASSCLTRQHSYSEPHAQRSAIVRRTASLKPQLPPKPLLLPPRPVLLPPRRVLLPSRPEPLPPCSATSLPSNQ